MVREGPAQWNGRKSGPNLPALDENIRPSPPTRPKAAEAKGTEKLSQFSISGDYFMKDLLTGLWGQVNKDNGTDVKLPDGLVW